MECPIEDPLALKPILGEKNTKSKMEQSSLKPMISCLAKTKKGFITGMIGRPILEVFEFTSVS